MILGEKKTQRGVRYLDTARVVKQLIACSEELTSHVQYSMRTLVLGHPLKRRRKCRPSENEDFL